MKKLDCRIKNINTKMQRRLFFDALPRFSDSVYGELDSGLSAPKNALNDLKWDIHFGCVAHFEAMDKSQVSLIDTIREESKS